MTIGDPLIFAIESQISQAYERLSFRGLGYFLIHIGGHCYGIRSPNATMLACSIDSVRDRIAERRKHLAEFANENALDIARCVYNAIYIAEKEKSYLGLSLNAFQNLIYQNKLIWAPDGDQAFDDCSFVLQFDIDDWVRLIGFRVGKEQNINSGTLSDQWLPINVYYHILETWVKGIEDQWKSMPKLSK